MTYIHTGALSGYAGAQSVNWWYGRLINKGVIPLFKTEDADKAPALPESHPYNNKQLKFLYVFSAVLVILAMFSLPFVFYLIQYAIVHTPEMLLFTNTVPVVLSIFPSILMAFWLSYTFYIKAGEYWPNYGTLARYSSIVAANKMKNGGALDKTKWENLVKPQHLEAIKQYEEQFYQKLTVWTLVICLPLYLLLGLTYDYVTSKGIVEHRVDKTVTREFKNVASVAASLAFKEEKNNGKYELRPKISINLIYKDGTSSNLCNFGCNNGTGAILETLNSLKNTYHAPIQVTPLKAYQKELLQNETPNTFLFYEQLISLGRS